MKSESKNLLKPKYLHDLIILLQKQTIYHNNMFESDDYDQVLSQFDLTELASDPQTKILIGEDTKIVKSKSEDDTDARTSAHSLVRDVDCKRNGEVIAKTPMCNERTHSKDISHMHNKRKIIDSFFDHRSKRKFPGPAGLLSSSFKENKDDLVSHMELLSQDVDFSQNGLQKDAFDSTLWKRLLADVKEWNLGVVDSIKGIKQQATHTGNLRRRKADMVTAFIEAVDRSITDPLITLRDFTGSIKCTLHRDAWSKFAPFIVSEYCALILWKPTVLTTGSAFKKHYLNITVSNIFAIYSSLVLKEETSVELPDGYSIVYEEDFTVIKGDKPSLSSAVVAESNGLCDDLDSFFSDEVF